MSFCLDRYNQCLSLSLSLNLSLILLKNLNIPSNLNLNVPIYFYQYLNDHKLYSDSLIHLIFFSSHNVSDAQSDDLIPGHQVTVCCSIARRCNRSRPLNKSQAIN